MSKRAQFFYLEFAVINDASFEALQTFFDRLQLLKLAFDTKINATTPSGASEEESWQEAQALKNRIIYDANWVLFLNESALDYFCSANPNRDVWDFESLLSAVLQAEYTLDSIERESPQAAVLFYDPWAYPFGSIDALRTLIECFGHRVTFESFYDGFEKWQSEQTPPQS